MTRPIIGYGEDALTFWMLSDGLGNLLGQLDENVSPADCLVFYRPSFGRGKNVGEFDAILVTRNCIYLIECKWQPPKPPKTPPVEIVLDKAQLNRHRVWKGMRKKWLECKSDMFTEIRIECEGFTLPTSDKTLARNSTFVFQQIDKQIRGTEKVKDICLYFIPEGDLTKPPSRVNVKNDETHDFKLVPIYYPPHHNISGFITLSAPVNPVPKN